jgi:NAD dependent epimerase/dehydratase family enzyme
MNIYRRFLVFYLGGGKGFVGQRLVQLLREKGFQNIWIVSRKSDGKENTLTWVYIYNE